MVQKKLPLINSAHGSETRNIINELIKLFNQMGYTYDQAMVMAQNILDEARQVNTENIITNERLDNIIAESGTSSTEVTDARVTQEGRAYTVLRERLNATDVQLHRTDDRIYSSNVQKKAKRAPMVVFIDDDGPMDVYDRLKPIFEEKGVPLTVSIATDLMLGTNNFMNPEHITELQNSGFEVVSHGRSNARFTDYATDEEIRFELSESKRILQSYGYNVENIVYPGGRSDERVRRIAKEFYKAGVSVNATARLNKPPVSNMTIGRVGLGSYFDTPTSEHPVTNTDVYYKNMVDLAVSENALLVFMMHCYHADHDAQQNQYLRNTIDYCQAQGVPIVNLRDAFKEYGNSIEVGDPNITTEPYSIVDAEGRMHENEAFSKDAVYVAENSMYSVSDPIMSFPEGKLTYIVCTGNFAIGAPENGRNGLMAVHRTSIYGDTYNYRTYHVAGTNRYYMSSWRNGAWMDWQQLAFSHEVTAYTLDINSVSESDLPADIPVGETSCIVTGFTQGNGILKTFNLGLSGYERQVFYRSGSPRIYTRTFNGTAWSEWQEVQTVV